MTDVAQGGLGLKRRCSDNIIQLMIVSCKVTTVGALVTDVAQGGLGLKRRCSDNIIQLMIVSCKVTTVNLYT